MNKKQLKVLDISEKLQTIFLHYYHVDYCNGMGVLVMSRTTSPPKSVLRYGEDNNLTSVWYSVFAQSCFPIKRTDSRKRVKYSMQWGTLVKT